MGFNSRECEFADIKVSVLGKELSGLRELSYKYSRDKELVYGAGSDPKSVQRGNRKTEGKLVVLKSDFDEMNLAARAAGHRNIVEVPGKNINITCVYQKDDGDPIKTDALINVEFTDFEDGMKQGDKFKEISLSFIFIRLKQS
jgi:hypothetical protein